MSYDSNHPNETAEEKQRRLDAEKQRTDNPNEPHNPQTPPRP